MRLPELQQRFKSAALGLNDATLLTRIEPGAITPEERFSVYRNNIFASLIGALGDSFTACKALVGEEFFTLMARTYARQHPPLDANLNIYGDRFAEFISRFKPAQSVPYLADVAGFEWARNLAFHAAPDNALKPEHLTGLSEDDTAALKLIPRASVQLLAVDYPVSAIWQYTQAQGSAPPELNTGGEFLLVWRPRREVQSAPLTRLEYLLLLGCRSGTTLEEAANFALTKDKTFDISAFLTKALQLEMFAALPKET